MHKPYGPIENTLDCIVQGHASLDSAIHDISQKIVELGTFVDQVTLKEVCYPRIWSKISKYANAIAATRSFRSEASWTSQHKPKFSSWTSTMHHLQIIITKLERDGKNYHGPPRQLISYLQKVSGTFIIKFSVMACNNQKNKIQMTLPNMQDGKANRGQTVYENHYQMFAPGI